MQLTGSLNAGRRNAVFIDQSLLTSGILRLLFIDDHTSIANVIIHPPELVSILIPLYQALVGVSGKLVGEAKRNQGERHDDSDPRLRSAMPTQIARNRTHRALKA